jgi:acid phosphatase family membrane protein YuiD
VRCVDSPRAFKFKNAPSARAVAVRAANVAMPRLASAFDNCGLVAAVIAVVAAQVLKPLTARVAGGPWKPSLALASGGFPSSHSAFVTALAAGVGGQWGYDSGAFACACVLSAVVMYDATGVRRQAGFHATAINTLVAGVYGTRGDVGAPANGGRAGESAGRYQEDEERAEQGEESLTDTLFDEGFDAFVRRLQERPLREHIGHTPVQVVAGAVTGIVIGVVVSFSVEGLE